MPQQRQRTQLAHGELRDVLVEALQVALSERPEQSVSGARLAQLMRGVAQSRGYGEPIWTHEPKRRFVDFLTSVPDLVTVTRGAGTDLRVAPADRPDLLTGASADVRVRPDLVRALTWLAPDGLKAWYDPATDTVAWPKRGTAPVPGAVQLPDPLATSLAARRRFVASITDTAPHHALTEALADGHPLSAFADALRRHQLQGAWRLARDGALAQELQSWAARAGLKWRDTWITTDVTARPPVPPEALAPRDAVSAGTPAGRDAEIAAFAHALASLDDDALARIAIPGDIVRRLLRPDPPRAT